MRTMIAVVTMVTPVMPMRAEIRRTEDSASLRFRPRRCRGRSDRCQTGKHERSRDENCRHQALHDRSFST